MTPIALTKPLLCAGHVLEILAKLVLLVTLASRAFKPLLRFQDSG